MSDKRQTEAANPDLKYLEALQKQEHETIAEFDKIVVALASGAFGVSFAFLKDYLGEATPSGKIWLFLAWALWAVSLGSVLWSFYCSHRAAGKSWEQYVASERDYAKLGQPWTNRIKWLNPISGISLTLGIIFMAVFLGLNLEDKRAKNDPSTIIQTTNAPYETILRAR